MKTIHIPVETELFEKLSRIKGDKTWVEFISLLLPKTEGIVNG